MQTNPETAKLYFPVEIPAEQNMRFAAHFFPATTNRRRVLQVLIHGNSYDHRYWNAATVNGEDYSYIAYMADRGYDLLAVDLPGVGESDKPNGHAVTLNAVSSAISAMVSSLKKPDAIQGLSFDHVALIGHSMGAAIAIHAEARAPSADSLIVTATGFFPGRPKSAWAPGAREALLAAPYATVAKESRVNFYHLPQADPQVVFHDNETMRCSTPSGLWADCISLQDDPNAGFAEVRCPVLIQLGEYDPILPAKFIYQERAIYRGSSAVTVHAIHDIGHSFNLHRNRHQGWERISDYLLGHVA
ncbi:alpha/beta fold hydrolase [Arthrobacter gyeryongensis]|uniref:Alpha/beta fold hydrolase n=1 Tax=Arthrobacter gyeryongensis TaxID=1650592 RepID=A0ABP9SFC7_9MICC